MKSKAAAHINYIQYRREERRETGVVEERIKAELRAKLGEVAEGQAEAESKDGKSRVREAEHEVEPDQKPGARQMYSQDNDYYSGAQLKKDIAELGRNDVVHKLIISPGHNDVDTKAYVREVMTELGRAKGQELRYGFVLHENTDHKHAHVVLIGRDKENHQVRIDKTDHTRIRAFGDRFLEREHNIERVLDRDMEEFCRTRNLNPMFEKERGDEFYERLYKGDKYKERNATHEQLEWEKFNNDWKKFIEDKEGTEQRPYLGRSAQHEVGRLSDFTALMNNDMLKDIWKDVGDNHPEMKELAEEKLAELERDRAELQREAELRTKAFDPFQAIENIASEISREQKQFQDLMKNGLDSNDSHTGIDLTQVDAADQLRIGDKTYTKYDTREELLEADAHCRESGSNWIPKDEYVQLWTWIGAKERFGDDCYGEAPRHERQEQDRSDGAGSDDRASEQSQGGLSLDASEPQAAQGKELDKDLKHLDEFVGFSEDKQLNLERDRVLIEPVVDKSRERGEDLLDSLLGFEREEGSRVELELATDRGLMFEAPLESEEADRDDRDDSDELFERGLN